MCGADLHSPTPSMSAPPHTRARVRVHVHPAIDVPDEGRALRVDMGGQVTELW
jgi:hypothetical protein